VYTDQFSSGKIVGFLKSQKYPNVSVLSKMSGQKKAGALNAALNVAKYKYVCTIDCDTILEQDTLLKVMSHVQKAPERVVGIGSYFGLANGFKTKDGKIIERQFVTIPLAAYQNLEYIRSFIGNRIGWSRLKAMPLVSGAFSVWRRDILVAAGAYASQYSSEDLECTLRVHDYLVRNAQQDYEIVMLPHYVGWTEGPHTAGQLIKQRSRWQRVINEAIWDYRHMLFNPRYGNLGLITLPYYLLVEVCGVFFEIASVVITLLAFLTGFLSVQLFLSFFTFMILCQTLVSLISLFSFHTSHRLFTTKEITYFIMLSFAEFFWYRWVISCAKVLGFVGFCRGNRAYDTLHRHKT
jgi:cellulose synthase/poly-beta-1,6-N-acetylglucosamine synthase-like glycosyltransferase